MSADEPRVTQMGALNMPKLRFPAEVVSFDAATGYTVRISTTTWLKHSHTLSSLSSPSMQYRSDDDKFPILLEKGRFVLKPEGQ